MHASTKQIIIGHYPKETVVRMQLPQGIFSRDYHSRSDKGNYAMVLHDDGTIRFESPTADGVFLVKKMMKPRGEYTLNELMELFNSVF